MFVCLRNCKNILYWDIKTVECNLDHRNSILVFILGNVEELNVDSVTQSLKTCTAEAHCGSHYRQRGKQVINISREEKSLTSALQRRSHFNLQSIGAHWGKAFSCWEWVGAVWGDSLQTNGSRFPLEMSAPFVWRMRVCWTNINRHANDQRHDVPNVKHFPWSVWVRIVCVCLNVCVNVCVNAFASDCVRSSAC